jgi:CheY-like chemotaxis protein
MAAAQGPPDDPVVVAVLNTNDDVVELLRLWLENAGFVVVSAHVDAIKRGEVDLEQFVTQHKPKVAVYDVPPPYERQWAFLTHLRQNLLTDTAFVITSTNAARLRELVGTSEPVLEIVGKPYDLDQILAAVKRAI